MEKNLFVGSVPEHKAMQPEPGRFQILSSDTNRYLYVSELQQIFGLKKDISELPDSNLSEIGSKAVVEILAQNENKCLPNIQNCDDGLRDVVIHVSQKCNLNCIYCYAHDLNKANTTMSSDVADKVISQTLSLTRNGLSSVKFLGGEPTLAWTTIERLVKGYLAKSSELGVSPPKFVIVTNGTNVNQKIIDFARKNKIFIWVSLDGPQDIHDQLRPTLGGRGSYNRASASLKSLIDDGVNVGVETVFTGIHLSKGISPQNLIDHFLSFGIREIQISPAIGLWHGCDTIEEMQIASIQFAEAARKSIQSHRTKNPYLLRGIDFVLRGFISRTKAPYICEAGRTLMAINYDGEAFPCYLLESPSTSYGYIAEMWDHSRYEKIRNNFACNSKSHHLSCRKCWANEICKSCLGTSFQISRRFQSLQHGFVCYKTQ